MKAGKGIVLLVEDNPGDVVLMREIFKRHGNNEFELVHKPCLQDALKQLSEEEIDVILLDLCLPETYGLETLVQVQKATPYTSSSY